MKIDNIYGSELLKYPLDRSELEDIDKAWELLEIIKKQYLFIFEYRKNLIGRIRKIYTVDEFYKLEHILNKLFWNLRWMVYPLFFENMTDTEEKYADVIHNNYKNINSLPNSLTICEFEEYIDDDDLKNKIADNKIYYTTYYRSYINKLIIVDKKSKMIMSKQMEGSSKIFDKNYFNLLTMTILFDKSLYEKIMSRPFILKSQKIELSKFYYQYDYGFPNLNFCTYIFGSKADRIDRIKKMYYYDGKNKAKYWKKLIL